MNTPSTKDQIKTSVVKNLPGLVGKTIQLLILGFVTVFRFVVGLFLEAIGRK